MTRLSATATIAALLLLAVAQGFGATKVTAKAATKGTAKPYHLTAQNQFHFKSTNPSKAQARIQSTEQQRAHGPHGRDGLAAAGRSAARRTPAPRAIKPRRHAANPPTGHIGFVSATQIPEGGESQGNVQAATLGGLTAFITVVDTGAGCAYSEVAANGDGTFTAPATALTLTAYATCGPNFVVGDLDGDGNSDIVEADSASSSYTVLLSNGDGTFTPGTSTVVTGASGFTGGALVLNATSTFLDAVVVDASTPSNIIVVPGNGDGTFGTAAAPVLLAPTAPAVGKGFGVILADFDGDGLIDVVENDTFNNQPNVYLAATTPTAYTGAALVTPDGKYNGCSSTAGSLVTGALAIVQTNCSHNTITVYNNDGTGKFSEGVYYASAVTATSNGDTFPEAATIADVNGDGNGDVVVTNDNGSDVTILTGNGDGTLNLTSVGYATGGFPRSPAIVADLNGDTLMDILVSDDNQSLVWMAGFGDGSFQASKNFYAPISDNNFAFGVGVASGDFNGDGLADVVVGNCCNSTVGITVFLSNPDGSLQPGVNYGGHGTLEYVTVGDFNGDGKLDIAASDDTGSVLIFSGTGNGTFVAGPIYPINGGFQGQLLAGAFNSSTAPGTGVAGFADIAVTTPGAGSVSMMINDGFGGFAVGAAIPLTVGGEQLAAADLNGDTFLDLAVAESGGNIGVLLGVGDGTFTAAADVALGTGFAEGVALADVSGDGIPDIVATDDNQSILVATGLGDGTFPNALITLVSSVVVSGTTPFFSPEPWSVQVADVDGDGVADLVYTNADYSTVGVIFGDGLGTATAPTFFDAVEFPTGGFVEGISVADLNGDGAPDAAAAPDDFAGASVLLNANGTGVAPNFSLSSSASSINVGDGSTGTLTVTLTPFNFYSGTVTFTCGNLPLGMTCAFAPATLTPVGNAALTSTLTITTLAPRGALHMPADANPHQGRTSLLACLTGMGLFGLLLAGDWKNKRNRRVGILLGILVLGMMFSLVGCSSSSKPGTPIGAQSITVTGTGSDAVTQAINVTVNVF